MTMRIGERCPLKKPSAEAGCHRIFPVSEYSRGLPAAFSLTLLTLRLRSSEELELAGDVFFWAEAGRLASSFREGGGDMWWTVAELEAAPSNETVVELPISLSITCKPGLRMPPALNQKQMSEGMQTRSGQQD